LKAIGHRRRASTPIADHERRGQVNLASFPAPAGVIIAAALKGNACRGELVEDQALMHRSVKCNSARSWKLGLYDIAHGSRLAQALQHTSPIFQPCGIFNRDRATHRLIRIVRQVVH
jgi:hypothetical protein